MYRIIILIHDGAFSLLNPVLLKNCFFHCSTIVSLITLFLLTIWNCYLIYRIHKTACVLCAYSYALQSKQT